MIRDFKGDMLASPSYGDSEITVERRYYARNQC
jgi:hypothetical protein